MDWTEEELNMMKNANFNNIDDILKLCKYWDIPFIVDDWVSCKWSARRYIERHNNCPSNEQDILILAFRRYVVKMNLKSFSYFHYNDTLRLNEHEYEEYWAAIYREEEYGK